MFGTLAIFGPGLLGGSLGMAARQRKLARHVTVWARRPEAISEAVKRNAADDGTLDAAAAAKDADLVVLATTIGAMETLAREILPQLSSSAIVTDVGSVKYPVVVALEHALGGKARFVGSHPMAGSEQAGIEAAAADLFQDAVCIVTPTENTDKEALMQVARFWEAVGMKVRTLSPAAHDEMVARVSHLPHLAAAALMNFVCEHGNAPMQFCGNGFRDATRIAAGPAEMWKEICMVNREELRRAIDGMIEELSLARQMLENKDDVSLLAFLRRAKQLREELKFRE
jgi:prephenate dehydrogenase